MTCLLLQYSRDALPWTSIVEFKMVFLFVVQLFDHCLKESSGAPS